MTMAAKKARVSSAISLISASDASSPPHSTITHSVLLESDARHVFPFLKLPPEIRNRIYDLVFVSPQYIGANGTLTKAFYHDAAKYRHLAFASACRQIYQESANIFYAKNGFEFFYIRPLLEFLEAIGAEGRKLLTKIKFSCTKGTPFIVLRYLKSCTNLQELEVSTRIVMPSRKNSWWAYPLKDAKGFFLGSNRVIEYEEVRGFGKAAAAAEGPDQRRIDGEKDNLTRSLRAVKREEKGLLKR